MNNEENITRGEVKVDCKKCLHWEVCSATFFGRDTFPGCVYFIQYEPPGAARRPINTFMVNIAVALLCSILVVFLAALISLIFKLN